MLKIMSCFGSVLINLTLIGIALSAEQHTSCLLEMILLGAKKITRADGSSVYSVSKVDSDLLNLFVNEKIYLEYAKSYLDAAQIDVA